MEFVDLLRTTITAQKVCGMRENVGKYKYGQFFAQRIQGKERDEILLTQFLKLKVGVLSPSQKILFASIKVL